MEIKQCPVLHPSIQEFDNFYEYIHSIDKIFKNDFGMVKIVPPSQWKPQSSNYENILQNLKVKNAIEQIAQGRGGYYQCKNIVQKQMPYKKYKRYSEKESLAVKGKSIEQKQKLFWKTITYSSPIYGADLTGSLMDQIAGSWNMNQLDSLLKYAMPHRIKGVTQPYCYIGTWKSFFSWHKEDLDLSAINYIHEGEPKIWYSVAPKDSYILQNIAQKHFRPQYQECREFMRHKTFLIHPEMLLKECPELKISRVTHNAGEIMLVFGGAYHEGFNCGFNIAQAVNYATLDWLGQILEAKSCSCSKRSVKTSIQSVLYHLQESDMFQELLEMESFQKIRSYVQQKQAEQLGGHGLIEEIEVEAKDVEYPLQNIYPVTINSENIVSFPNDEQPEKSNIRHKYKTKKIKRQRRIFIKKSEQKAQEYKETLEPQVKQML